MTTDKKGWFTRLKEGLQKSSTTLTQGLTSIITKRKLDEQMLEELEELLITADLGAETAASLTASLAKNRFNQDVSVEEVQEFLAHEIAQRLAPLAQELKPEGPHTPFVLLVVGVNGGGKTTTIGKLAHYWKSQGYKVRLAAGDTFRAAAVEQLKTWAHRAGVPLVTGPENCDPAGLAFDALKLAKEKGDDVLIIDTAGRLQNKAHLMAELSKIERVIQKVDPTAPHGTLLVLDATTGQNAHSQVEIFKQTIEITGLVLTKLDGTAKGGVLVCLAQKHQLPLYAIGVGEGIDDLKPFKAEDFARGLLGLG
jgi:fused signal recognition particle receptor